MVSISLDVTEADILEGKRNLADCCPIALAIRRRYPYSSNYVPVEVSCSQARIKGIWYDLPDEAKSFIRDFDCGRPVKPFTFRVTWQPPRRWTLDEIIARRIAATARTA